MEKKKWIHYCLISILLALLFFNIYNGTDRVLRMMVVDNYCYTILPGIFNDVVRTVEKSSVTNLNIIEKIFNEKLNHKSGTVSIIGDQGDVIFSHKYNEKNIYKINDDNNINYIEIICRTKNGQLNFTDAGIKKDVFYYYIEDKHWIILYDVNSVEIFPYSLGLVLLSVVFFFLSLYLSIKYYSHLTEQPVNPIKTVWSFLLCLSIYLCIDLIFVKSIGGLIFFIPLLAILVMLLNRGKVWAKWLLGIALLVSSIYFFILSIKLVLVKTNSISLIFRNEIIVLLLSLYLGFVSKYILFSKDLKDYILSKK